MPGRENGVVGCTWSIQAGRGAEGGKGGKIYEMWRRHKLKTHGKSEIEVVHVGE